MIRYLLEMFTVSLLLTQLLELPVAYALGMRGKKQLLLVFLLNILTNPAAVCLSWLGVSQIPIELSVIAVEAGVYGLFSKDTDWTGPHPVVLAVTANLISWSAGLLIQYIGG